MGKQYEDAFEQLVEQLRSTRLRAFIDTTSVNPKYVVHIRQSLHGLGIPMVADREEANFVVAGYVVRDSDGAVGLLIHTQALGPIELFPPQRITVPA